MLELRVLLTESNDFVTLRFQKSDYTPRLHLSGTRVHAEVGMNRRARPIAGIVVLGLFLPAASEASAIVFPRLRVGTRLRFKRQLICSARPSAIRTTANNPGPLIGRPPRDQLGWRHSDDGSDDV